MRVIVGYSCFLKIVTPSRRVAESRFKLPLLYVSQEMTWSQPQPGRPGLILQRILLRYMDKVQGGLTSESLAFTIGLGWAQENEHWGRK